MNKKDNKFQRKIISFITSFAFITAVAGASVALAALTFTSNNISSDGALTLSAAAGALNLSGTASSTLDLGAGSTLFLQTTNNGPITAGGGLFTVSGNLTATGTVTAAAFVASSSVINGSLNASSSAVSSLTVNGGSAITKIKCATTSLSVGSVAIATGTTAFDIALTGVSTSSNQAYFVGIASSGAQTIKLTANPTSTAGYLTVQVQNVGLTVWGGSTSTYSVCFMQF